MEDFRAARKVTSIKPEETVPQTPPHVPCPCSLLGLGAETACWPGPTTTRRNAGVLPQGLAVHPCRVESWRGLPCPSGSTHTSTLSSVSTTQRKRGGPWRGSVPEGVFSHSACLGFSSGRPHGTGAGGAELWEVGAANKGVLFSSGPGLIPLGTFQKLCPTPWRSTQKIPRRPENPIPGAAPWGFIPF